MRCAWRCASCLPRHRSTHLLCACRVLPWRCPHCAFQSSHHRILAPSSPMPRTARADCWSCVGARAHTNTCLPARLSAPPWRPPSCQACSQPEGAAGNPLAVTTLGMSCVLCRRLVLGGGLDAAHSTVRWLRAVQQAVAAVAAAVPRPCCSGFLPVVFAIALDLWPCLSASALPCAVCAFACACVSAREHGSLCARKWVSLCGRARMRVFCKYCQACGATWLLPRLNPRRAARCLPVLQLADAQAMRCQMVWGLSLCRVSGAPSLAHLRGGASISLVSKLSHPPSPEALGSTDTAPVVEPICDLPRAVAACSNPSVSIHLNAGPCAAGERWLRVWHL